MEFGLVARWLVVYALLWAAGLPVAARLLEPLDGRGAGFALPVSLVVVTTVAYWVGQVTFGPVTLAVALLVLLAVAAAAALDRDALRDGEFALAPDLEVDRAALTETAIVFLAAFLFLLAVRAADPAVHAGGGEKFLDYGLLKALDRAPSLPPEDIWFAGAPVRYYFGGHLLTAVLADLAFTPTRYAYNIALAGFYAMLVTAAYDLAAAVAAARGANRTLAGVTATFFVGFASNVATAARFAVLALPGGLEETAARMLAQAASNYEVEEILAGWDAFGYWDASRVVPGTINEFPLFAWLNGDLHAHMMGTPFVLLAAALAYSYYLTPAARLRRRRVLVFGAVPALAGLQAVVDTWSFPTVFGLLALALVFAPPGPLSLLPGGDRIERRLADRAGDGALVDETGRVAAAGVVVAVAGLLGFLLASHFLLANAGGREVAVLPTDARSGFFSLLLVHGAFLAAFGVYLTERLRVDRRLPVAGGLAAVAVAAVVQDLHVLLVTAPLLVAGWVALRLDRDVGYEAVLVVAGAGLVTIVELVYVKEQAGPLRMNTVFKTYMQVWVLWGVAAGAALSAFVGARTRSSVSPLAERRLKSVFLAVLVVSTAVYGVGALHQHFDRAETDTLDATAFVEQHHPSEAPAIDWLDEREGTPTMVSAPATWRYPLDPSKQPAGPRMYRWNANPAASLTGIPTVAGWEHEVGYRGVDPYVERVRAVDLVYTGTPAERAAALRRYDVEYVWVGPAERLRYGDVSLADAAGLTPVYRTDAVVVYRVDRGELPPS